MPGSAGIRNCSAFCQTCCNMANAPHFHGKRCRKPGKAPALYMTAHCSTTIKVQRFRQEKYHFFKCRRAMFVAFFLTRTIGLTVSIHVNLDFKGKQGNKPESPLFYFNRKKAAQLAFAPMTSCFQGSHSTTKATQLFGFKSHKLCKEKHLISPDYRVNSNSISI